MTEKELRAACCELMATADIVYMTVIDADGYPCTRAMRNLRNREQYPGQVHLYEKHGDDLTVYITTKTSSRKMNEIRANPRVGLYFCHAAEVSSLSLLGDAEIVDDMAIRQGLWVDEWARYYPTTQNAEDPDYTVVRLRPKKVQGWNKAQMFELVPTQSG